MCRRWTVNVHNYYYLGYAILVTVTIAKVTHLNNFERVSWDVSELIGNNNETRCDILKIDPTGLQAHNSNHKLHVGLSQCTALSK